MKHPDAMEESRIRLRTALALTLLAALVIGANVLAGYVTSVLDFEIRPGNEDLVHRTLMVLAAVYLLLIAVPFVPAIEIGLVLIAIFGPVVAVLVYVCTIAGLTISFLVGRLIPTHMIVDLFDELRLRRASRLLAKLEHLHGDARLAFLLQSSASRVASGLLRHRYLALAIAVNVPGNVMIGGGGGIAVSAGASRLFSAAGFVATISAAVAPVPLAVLLFGKEVVTG